MAAFAAYGGDVAAEGLAYPQPIQGRSEINAWSCKDHTGGQGRAGQEFLRSKAAWES